MKVIEDLYVSFELATLAKEILFEVECFAFFRNKGLELANDHFNVTTVIYDDLEFGDIICPVYDQLIDWLDEEHRIRFYTKPTIGGNFTYGIYTWQGGANGWAQYTGIVEKSFNTKKEALEFGLPEAFKLIK